MGGHGKIGIGNRAYTAPGMGYKDNLMNVILEGLQQARERAMMLDGSERKHFKEFMEAKEGWERDDAGMAKVDERIDVMIEDGKITGVKFNR